MRSILNFFRRQVKKVLQTARVVVSLGMEQITNIIMPWFIFGLAITVIVLPIVLDIMEKIERGKK